MCPITILTIFMAFLAEQVISEDPWAYEYEDSSRQNEVREYRMKFKVTVCLISLPSKYIPI